MLRDAGMPWKPWGEALNHSASLEYCIILSALQGITPHESLLGTALGNLQFRMLGCALYEHVENKGGGSD